MKKLNVLSQLILHSVCQYDAQNTARNNIFQRGFPCCHSISIFLVFCVCVKGITLCNCLCSFCVCLKRITFAIACVLLLLLFLVFLPVLSGISGNSEQKAILQTAKELIQYTVLQIQFRSLKYTTVIRIRKHLSNFPFRPKR